MYLQRVSNSLENWLLLLFQISVSLLTLLFQILLDNRDRVKAREDTFSQKLVTGVFKRSDENMPRFSSISILSLMITDDSGKCDPSLAPNLLLGLFPSFYFFIP